MDDATLQFYRQNAEAYARREITSRYARMTKFLALLPSDAAILELGCLAAQLTAHLGCGGRVEVEAASLALAVELHAVEKGAVIAEMPAMNHGVAVHRIDVAADVLRRGRDPGANRHLREPAHFLGQGQRIEQLARHDLVLSGGLHIDHRRFAEDGNRLLQLSDAHLGDDVRREVRCELQPFPLDGAESDQRERDGIGAARQVEDLVLSLRVGDDSADLFDECGTGRFDGYSRQHCPRCITHNARDGAGALCARMCRRNEYTRADRGSLESHRSSFAFTDTRVPGKVLLAPPSCARIERSEAQNYTVGPALAAHISFLRRATFRTAFRC